MSLPPAPKLNLYLRRAGETNSEMSSMSRIAVVTGSNKGLGFGIVKGLCQRFDGIVYLTSRDVGRGRKAVADLNKLGLKPAYHQLDVSDRNSVIRFRDHIKEEHEGLDILVNNAGIGETNSRQSTYSEAKCIIDNNFGSVLIIQDLIYPLVRKNGQILNISSSCGHLSNIKNNYWVNRLCKKVLTLEDINEFVDWFLESKRNGTFDVADIADGAVAAAYRISKVALSALTMVQQKEYESKNISINSIHPGIVRTDMSLGVGHLSVDEAARTILNVILKSPHTLKGSYLWCDGRVVDWFDYDADYYFKIKEYIDLYKNSKGIMSKI